MDVQRAETRGKIALLPFGNRLIAHKDHLAVDHRRLDVAVGLRIQRLRQIHA